MTRNRATAWLVGGLLLVFLLALLVTSRLGAAPVPQQQDGGQQQVSTSVRSSDPGDSDDGLAVIAEAALPQQARDTLRLIDSGGPFPYQQDGAVYENRNRQLPKHKTGWYHEYTVKTPGSRDRGARRLVCGQDKTCYYTADHYATFARVNR